MGKKSQIPRGYKMTDEKIKPQIDINLSCKCGDFAKMLSMINDNTLIFTITDNEILHRNLESLQHDETKITRVVYSVNNNELHIFKNR